VVSGGYPFRRSRDPQSDSGFGIKIASYLVLPLLEDLDMGGVFRDRGDAKVFMVWFGGRHIISVATVAVGAWCCVSAESAQAEARIFVIKEADGAIRFTNKPPLPGQDAQIFTSTETGGKFFRTASPLRLKSGETLYRSSRASLKMPGALPFVIKGGRSKIYPGMYADAIETAAALHNVDAALVRAVIHAESAFNPYAVSPKGAQGLMQLMPATARMLGVNNSFSPESNIHGGTKYLAQLLRRFRNEALAVAAYNAGEVPVTKYNGIPPYSETRAYVRRVLQLKKQYSLQLNG